LLTPDREINNAFLYCLIEAAQKFDIVLLLSQMMSNHQHTSFYDPHGFAVEFTHRFHTHIAKCVNAYRGRWENMWSSEPPCLVELEQLDDVIDKLIYTATNPVKDDLVERVDQWPGPRTVRSLLEGRVLKAYRPWFLFRKDGPMPDQVELTFTIPPEVGDRDEIVERIRAGIASVEEECARNRANANRRVLGRRRVLRQSWRDSPTSHEPRRGLRPRVAARSKWARIEALRRNREFEVDYRIARRQWLAGEPAVFPVGTYWLRKFANVTVAPAEKPPPIAISNA
jgi:hypothetical protein